MSSVDKALSRSRQVRKRKRSHGSSASTLSEGFEHNLGDDDQPERNIMSSKPCESSPKQVSLSESVPGTCARCSSLNIDRLLHTTDVRTYADTTHISGWRGHPNVPKGRTQIELGLFREIEFNPQCSLCELIKGLVDPTTIKADEHVFLIPAFSIHRLEPDVSLVRYGKSCKYTIYLYLGQMVEEYGQMRLPYCHEVSNAFGYALTLEPDHIKETMRLRPVDPFQVNIELVHHWLSLCERNHGDVCKVLACPALGIIRVIDVEERKIVPYKEIQDHQYLCLSYVWGQEKVPVDLTLQDIPPTISDAIKFVRLLGKRYLWVDALCINQQDSIDKTQHIKIMNKIYRGAWATIVALDAENTYSGIPRVDPKPGGVAKAKQLSCLHLGKRLLTTLPTLRQQVNKSKWATRAWTYQEAILSPRCLYFTADQVYFECNLIQCCESIEESGSSYHDILDADRRSMLKSCVCHGGSQNAIGRGVFRDPLSTNVLENDWMIKKHRRERYNQLLEAYSSRSMSFNSDALNAFEAVLQQLSSASFTRGHFWGIPVEILPSALLWEHRDLPTRRVGFPSWSWAGWEGGLFKASLAGETPYQPPFKAWKAEKTTMGYELALLYESSQAKWPDWKPGYDPILDAMFTPENELQILPTHNPSLLDFSQALFVNAIRFRPGLLKLCLDPCANGFMHSLDTYRFECRINQVNCHFFCHDIETKDALCRSPADLLLVKRAYYIHYGWVYEYLLLGILPCAEKGAQRIGRVRMYFGDRDGHNESSRTVFTPKTMRMDILALF